ncbi:MAG: hypothetical protein ACFFDN_49220 [Candidatus Hodarchaeota archaeon]
MENIESKGNEEKLSIWQYKCKIYGVYKILSTKYKNHNLKSTESA